MIENCDANLQNRFYCGCCACRDRDNEGRVRRAIERAKDRGLAGLLIDAFNDKEYQHMKAYTMELWPEAIVKRKGNRRTIEHS